MAYLIDGHNLIGQLPDLRLNDPNDEARLVQKLLGFSARTGKRIIVVFDHGLPGGTSRLSQGRVQVIFAARPGEADDVMLRRIRDERDVSGWVVVSSDSRVLAAAQARGMQGMRASAFAPLLATAAGGTSVQLPPPKPRGRRGEADSREKPTRESSAEIDAWLKAFGADDPDA